MQFDWQEGISLRAIASHYRGKVAITWLLLLIESLLALLFPLVIGYSVDDLLVDSFNGLYALVGLIVAVLIIGAARRFYDTRAYAAIYRDLGETMVAHKSEKGVATTSLTALVNLLQEIVEFFEHSAPELLGVIVSFVGVVIMLGLIDLNVMALCIVGSILVVLIYSFSSKRIYRYNVGMNDEFERQVDVLDDRRPRRVRLHLGRIMQWTIRLSDLETVNYSLGWLAMASVLAGSIYLIVENASISYGIKITSIMYVFEYIGVVMSLPLFYQQLVRLQEITARLSSSSRDE